MTLLRMMMIACAMVFAAARGVQGQTVAVDYEPSRFHQGGVVADSSDVYFGSPSWQFCADSFTTSTDWTISAARWWAYFYDDNPTPSASEVVELLIHTPRADGLPGSTIYDQQFVSPARAKTGVRISLNVLPHEYDYRADLPTPINLPAGTYWFEVRAVGDMQSIYTWEYTNPNSPPFAFRNPATAADWESSSPGNLGTAFQLIAVPEPGAIFLVGSAATLLLGRRRKLMAHR